MPIRKVLLADGAAETVRQQLKDGTPWQVLVVATAPEALHRARAERPDVILLDETMATDILPRLSAEKATASIPVFLVHRSAQAERPAGVAGVITRPLDTPAFPAELRRLYEEARLRAQLGRLHELGGEEFVHEMIDLYLESSPPRLTAARNALQAGNLAEVRQAVHALKSSAGNLGGDTVYDLCGRIEEHATANRGNEVASLLAELESAFARFQERLAVERGAKP